MTPEIKAKVCNIIRRLSSDKDGEIVAAINVLRRIADVHEIAECIEQSNGKLNEAEARRIYDAGFAAGAQASETPGTVNGFFNAVLEWTDVARFVWRNKHRLASKHHEFIDKVAAQAESAWPREPTQKMHQYLHSLFIQLGGKIT
jgi:hypothetical protein